VDPNEPTLPPHVTAKQAAHFAESLARGTPGRRKIVQTVLENKVRELL
jgi:pyruvate dehydrogenase (quinone)/pyruvate oxidase